MTITVDGEHGDAGLVIYAGLDAAELMQAGAATLMVSVVDGDVALTARSDEELWVVHPTTPILARSLVAALLEAAAAAAL